jgi:hypothetical protein
MGVLDEAIREHLDLKRRRGADPGEIERAEQEALGPVRRGPGEPDDADSEPQLATEQELAYNGEAAEEWPERFERDSSTSGSLAADDDPFAEEHFAPPDERFADADERFPDSEERFDSPEERFAAADERFAPEKRLAPEEDHPASESHEAPAPHPAEPAASPKEPFPSREPVDHVGQETAEYDVEKALQKGEGEKGKDEKGEDVLEETPEFLQDTPEHDRLWFEQRPPKDFDFEG